MSTPSTVPKEHRALVFQSRELPPRVDTVPVPQVGYGACIVRIHGGAVLPYTREVFTGKRPYPLPFPMIGGPTAIARIAALPPDSTSLKMGQLVHVECFLHARDNPDIRFLWGWHQGDTVASARLMDEAWHDGSYAEYARVPLENIEPLDETRLLGPTSQGGLGYQLDDLLCLGALLIPFGGLDDIQIKVGERVIIAPATGWFGGAAVMVALAMGARVIAAGRNLDSLSDIKRRMGTAYGSERVETVQLSGDLKTDIQAFKSFGPVDAFFEISPPAASKANFISAAIQSLRVGGRVSLMGGVLGDMEFPIRFVMHNNIRVFGKWMYERDAIWRMLKMIECGALKLGPAGGWEVVGSWQLDDWDRAFTAAAENSTIGKMALLKSFSA